MKRTPTIAAAISAIALLLSGGNAHADISGTVVDQQTKAPLAGAVVSIRARPDIPRVITQADGTFVMPLNEANIFEVAAAVAYDHDAPINYLTNAQQAFDGMTNIEIQLSRLSVVENPGYQPASASNCASCHSAYFQQWSSSRHAGAAQNPWVLDLFSGTGTPGGAAGYVFRDTHDEGDSGTCATCHAPLQDVFTPGELMLDEVSTEGGLDGVTCLACHQIAHVNDNVQNLHHLGNAEYRFPDADAQTMFHVWGPLPDVDMFPMQNSYSPLFEDSKLCASCHEYDNPTTGAPGQTTYSEWLASDYAQPGPGYRTCQSCHMPERTGMAQIGAGGPPRPGSQRHSHRFIGATPTTLAANIDLRIELERQGDEIVVYAEVENQCGHNFPTGISIRNALLVVDATIGGQPLVQLEGSTIPYWGSDDVPGDQPGDYAGAPGRGFAKVLQGRINGQGDVIQPVLFIDAESVASDTTIPSGAIDVSTYRFALPPDTEGQPIRAEVRLLYRRAWRALAITKGWTQTPGGMPVEIEVQRRVLQINVPPVAVGSIPDQLGAEGISISLDTSAYFSDPNGDLLGFAASGLPDALSIGAASGMISGTFAPNSAGMYAVVVTASDPDGESVTQAFNWEVVVGNIPPVPVGTIPGQQHAEGDAVSLDTASAFTDPNGDVLAYSATGLPPDLDIDATSGLVSGTIGFDAAGSHDVLVTATDPDGESATQAFVWVVTDTNRPPMAVGAIANRSDMELREVTLAVAAFFSDPDDDPLEYSAGPLPPGLAVDATSGIISGTLAADSTGSYEVVVVASDPDGASAQQAFTWQVSPFESTIFENGFEH
jgi:hypothetical protein